MFCRTKGKPHLSGEQIKELIRKVQAQV
jgi:hypothetical protein